MNEGDRRELDGAGSLRPVALVGQVWLRFGALVDGGGALRVGVELSRVTVAGDPVRPGRGSLVVLVPVVAEAPPSAGMMLAASVDVADVAALVSRAFGIEAERVAVDGLSGSGMRSSLVGSCCPGVMSHHVEVRVSWAEVVPVEGVEVFPADALSWGAGGKGGAPS